jgi:hypothetical protein
MVDVLMHDLAPRAAEDVADEKNVQGSSCSFQFPVPSSQFSVKDG